MKSTIMNMNKETDEEKNDLQIINENNKKKLIFFNQPLFSIWSIGRPHCRTVRKGVNDYTRRVGHYCNIDWKITEALKHMGSPRYWIEFIQTQPEYIYKT